MKTCIRTFAKSSVLATALMTVAACDGGPQNKPQGNPAPTTEAAVRDNLPSPDQDLKTGPALANGAPMFATLYPDATLVRPVMTASENGRTGGIAEFNTSAEPDIVIAHYRQLSQNDNLKPFMQMEQSNARAFGARSVKGSEIQVVATRLDDGRTSVQLTWHIIP